MAEQINLDQFDVAVPWNDIPLSDTVEEGRYVLRVRELKLALTKEGKLMVGGYFLIDDGPLMGVNFPIQNYVLGTDDDKLCRDDPYTWRKSFGGRQLNQMLEACGSQKDERSLRGTLKRAEGTRFQAYVTKNAQQSGDYKGQDQNRVTRYGKYGEEMIIPGRPAATGMNGQYTVTPGGVSAQPRSRMRPTLPGQNQEPELDDVPEFAPSAEVTEENISL